MGINTSFVEARLAFWLVLISFLTTFFALSTHYSNTNCMWSEEHAGGSSRSGCVPAFFVRAAAESSSARPQAHKINSQRAVDLFSTSTREVELITKAHDVADAKAVLKTVKALDAISEASMMQNEARYYVVPRVWDRLSQAQQRSADADNTGNNDGKVLERIGDTLDRDSSVTPKKSSKKAPETFAELGACVGWHQTGGCTPRGPHERVVSCGEVIGRGSSGYCECARPPNTNEGDSNNKKGASPSFVEWRGPGFGCDHEPFRCVDLCALRKDAAVNGFSEEQILDKFEAYVSNNNNNNNARQKERIKRVTANDGEMDAQGQQSSIGKRAVRALPHFGLFRGRSADDDDVDEDVDSGDYEVEEEREEALNNKDAKATHDNENGVSDTQKADLKANSAVGDSHYDDDTSLALPLMRLGGAFEKRDFKVFKGEEKIGGQNGQGSSFHDEGNWKGPEDTLGAAQKSPKHFWQRRARRNRLSPKVVAGGSERRRERLPFPKGAGHANRIWNWVQKGLQQNNGSDHHNRQPNSFVEGSNVNYGEERKQSKHGDDTNGVELKENNVELLEKTRRPIRTLDPKKIRDRLQRQLLFNGDDQSGEDAVGPQQQQEDDDYAAPYTVGNIAEEEEEGNAGERFAWPADEDDTVRIESSEEAAQRAAGGGDKRKKERLPLPSLSYEQEARLKVLQRIRMKAAVLKRSKRERQRTKQGKEVSQRAQINRKGPKRSQANTREDTRRYFEIGAETSGIPIRTAGEFLTRRLAEEKESQAHSARCYEDLVKVRRRQSQRDAAVSAYRSQRQMAHLYGVVQDESSPVYVENDLGAVSAVSPSSARSALVRLANDFFSLHAPIPSKRQHTTREQQRSRGLNPPAPHNTSSKQYSSFLLRTAVEESRVLRLLHEAEYFTESAHQKSDKKENLKNNLLVQMPPVIDVLRRVQAFVNISKQQWLSQRGHHGGEGLNVTGPHDTIQFASFASSHFYGRAFVPSLPTDNNALEPFARVRAGASISKLVGSENTTSSTRTDEFDNDAENMLRKIDYAGRMAAAIAKCRIHRATRMLMSRKSFVQKLAAKGPAASPSGSQSGGGNPFANERYERTRAEAEAMSSLLPDALRFRDPSTPEELSTVVHLFSKYMSAWAHWLDDSLIGPCGAFVDPREEEEEGSETGRTTDDRRLRSVKKSVRVSAAHRKERGVVMSGRPHALLSPSLDRLNAFALDEEMHDLIYKT